MALFLVAVLTLGLSQNALAEDIVGPVLDIFVDESIKKSNKERQKKADSEMIESLPPEQRAEAQRRLEMAGRDTLLSLEGGFLQGAFRSSRDQFQADGGRLIRFHWDLPFQVFGIFKVPFVFHDMSISFSDVNGDANYSYVGDSNIHYTGNFPVTLRFATIDYGYRIRPLQGRSEWQPFLGVGVFAGWSGVEVAGSARSTLDLQGDDYRLNESLLAYGHALEGGLEYDIVIGIGIDVSYRYTSLKTTESKILGTSILRDNGSFKLGLHWRF